MKGKEWERKECDKESDDRERREATGKEGLSTHPSIRFAGEWPFSSSFTSSSCHLHSSLSSLVNLMEVEHENREVSEGKGKN